MQFIKEEKTGTDAALVAFAQSAVPILEQHLAGAAELTLSHYGITPPTGNSLGSLTSTLAAGLRQSSGSLLSDITSLVPQKDLTEAIAAGPTASSPVDPQQISQLVTAVLHIT